jgi:hypothetical protein
MPITTTNPFEGRRHPVKCDHHGSAMVMQYPLACEHLTEWLASNSALADANCMCVWLQAYDPEEEILGSSCWLDSNTGDRADWSSMPVVSAGQKLEEYTGGEFCIRRASPTESPASRWLSPEVWS